MDPKMALLTRQAARDNVAKLCFIKKRDSNSSKKRVPRFDERLIDYGPNTFSTGKTPNQTPNLRLILKKTQALTIQSLVSPPLNLKRKGAPDQSTQVTLTLPPKKKPSLT